MAFEQGLVVGPEDFFNRRLQLQLVKRHAVNDADASPPRAHGYRGAKPAMNVAGRLALGAGEYISGRGRHVVEAEHLLGFDSVRRDGGGQHIGARVGNAHELQESLQTTSLAMPALKG